MRNDSIKYICYIWDSITRKGIAENEFIYESPDQKSSILALNVIIECCTFLNNNVFRISMDLRLGTEICKLHYCTCGEKVKSNGSHSLSCTESQGRFSCHAELIDITKCSAFSLHSSQTRTNRFAARRWKATRWNVFDPMA